MCHGPRGASDTDTAQGAGWLGGQVGILAMQDGQTLAAAALAESWSMALPTATKVPWEG